MTLFGRIAMVCGWTVLAACGAGTPETGTPETATQAAEISPTTCPQLVPPADNFCPNGTIVPVYSGKCIIAYSCT